MFTVEQIQDHIPKYLTAAQQSELVGQLREFETKNYYTALFAADILQGDGWNSLEVIRFETGDRAKIKGILLSNSCDIAPENPREIPPRIVFAPLVRLKDFAGLLERASLRPEQIADKIDAIRKQRISSLLYLPQGGALDDEHIAVLDDLHNVPRDHFSKRG
jgi:hypothetical protein